MASDDQKQIITQTLRFREIYPDGRIVTIIDNSLGEWKIEIFASLKHAVKFANDNNIEILS